MNEKSFKIRDLRKKEQFIVDDAYINGYAIQAGIYGTGVYLELCRHAGRDQTAFPSIEHMAEKLGIGRDSVIEGIKKLQEFNIIQVKRLGKRLCNQYTLLDKSEWVKSATATSPKGGCSRSQRLGEVAPSDSKDAHSKDAHNILPASPPASGSSQGVGEELVIEPSDDFTPSRALQRREAKERGYKGAETNPLLAWGEARVGRRFPNPLKQKRFIADMLRVGYSSEAIKEAWLELEDSEWWLKRGFDFADVAGQIGKLKVRRRA